MPRLLKNIDVHFISLVHKGANKKKIIWKSADDIQPTLSKTIPIRKIDEEKRMVYGIVYSPDEEDTQGDFTTAEEIEKAAHRFMREGRTTHVDKQHDYEPDEGYIAESWIVKKGDPIFPEDKGAWAVGIKVENDETWEEVKKGEITGISLAGMAEAIEIEKEEKGFFKKVIDKFLKKDFNSKINQRHFWDIINAFHSTVNEIFSNDEIEDKKGAILAAVDQMKEYINTHIEKAGRKISSANLTKLKEAYNVLGEIIQNAESQKKQGVRKMEKEEIKKMIEETVQPLREQIQKFNESVEQIKQSSDEMKKSLEERIEKMEKETPGKQSVEGQEPVEKKDDRIWV